jgi:flagellin-like protein
MRKLLKNKKALSPVVAAIILIAVTVAVSIAVAAWMGSLTIGFMETSEITINRMQFVTADTGVGADTINVTMTDSGTSDVTIGMVKVNGNTIDMSSDVTRIDSGATADDFTLDAGEQAILSISYDSSYATNGVVAGNKYSVNFFATDGTLIGSFTDTA